MGILDDAVPGGNIAKPLLIALGALLAGKLLAGRADPEPETAAPPQPEPTAREASPRETAPQRPAGNGQDGGLLDGLGDLLDRMQRNGQGKTADSWVKPGQNEPISPGDLGTSIGQKTLSEIARQTGMSEEQLLEQLSKVLPGVVDKLTPNGKVPTNQEVAREIGKSPW